MARSQPRWIKDEHCARCFSCNATFTLFNRRHHCRLCGRIFCDTCTRRRTNIPSLLRCSEIASPPTAMNPRSFMESWFGGQQDASAQAKRVCDACYAKSQNLLGVQDYVKCIALVTSFGLLPVDWKRLACVSRTFRDTSRIICDEWTSVWHLIAVNARMTPLQKRLIEGMSWALDDHLNYLPLIDTQPQKSFACPRVNCCEIGCHVDCRRAPPIAPAIIDLVLGNWRARAIERILRSPETSKISCISLTNVLSSICSVDRFIVADLLIPLVTHMRSRFHAEDLAQRLYFGLRARDAPSAALFLKHMPAPIQKQIDQAITLVACICAVALAPRQAMENEAGKLPAEGAPLPHRPGVIVRRILYDNVKSRRSHTKPVVVPLLCQSQDRPEFVLCVMFKAETLLMDAAVLEFSTLFSQIARVQDHVQYDVLPVSKTSGLVYCVQGARTLGSLQRDCLTLQNWVCEHNQYETVGNLKRRFVESSAFATTSSLLLRYGDRHLDNLMLSKEGRLFHIDFTDHIMGHEPLGKYLFQNTFRVTQSMLDFMGGEQSRYYDHFKSRCVELYHTARQWTALLSTTLYPLSFDGYMTQLQISNHLESVFRPGNSTMEEARVEVSENIKSSSSQKTIDTLADMWHNMFQ